MTKNTTTPAKLHEYLLSVVNLSKKSFVVLGRVLYNLKQNNVFAKSVGSGAATWDDYLRQPEIGLSANEANRLISIYKEFILRLGYDEDTISAIPVKNMHYLLPLVRRIKTREEADELVADATLLSQRDFKLRIYDVKAAQMGIDVTKTYEYFIMRRTKETSTLDKVHDISSDVIKQTFNLE